MKATRLLLSALLGGATVVVLSCGDPAPLGVGSRGLAPQAELVDSLVQSAGLLTCSALPYDSATQTIGPEGGVLAVGPHWLAVPPGALDASVSITAVVPSDSVNRVRFQPEGLTFQQPASLTMSYANCNLLGSTLPKQIAHTTDALEILELLPSVDDLSAQAVTGQLSHFSEYAVAW